MKKIYALLVFTLLINVGSLTAQNGLALSISDLLGWSTATANPANISPTSLSPRVKSPNYQIANGLDTNARIMYCPDGMNTFGNYIDSANQFNLLNFSHWQYVDILVWFGGGASTPIILPSKAWVDAAHKNGVKVIGTVFFAPTVYGGTETAVQNFMQQDAQGHFIAAQKLIQIANYYNFDGWFLNFETPVNSTLGGVASHFVSQLDSIYSGEVIWYDAMLQDGTINYQNRANATNGYFLQHSTGLFTNYAWTRATTVTSSNTYATSVGVNPYNVYTGADMWPGRTAQPAFSNSGWIDKIFNNQVAKTSIALFATNFPFNSSTFSNFNNDPNDYNNFYIAERKIFSGEDQDPFVTDANWKGLAYYIPVRTTYRSLPFSTDFNTGHGMNYYYNGTILRPGGWHNMSHQSNLPSFTFKGNPLQVSYNFTDAYNGGSCLQINGSAAGAYSIPLYSTDMVTNSNVLNAFMAMKSGDPNIDSIAIEFKRKGTTQTIKAVFHPQFDGTWETLHNNHIACLWPDTLIGINLNVYASGAFSLLVGQIDIDRGNPAAVNTIFADNGQFVAYPNPSPDGIISFQNKEQVSGQLYLYDINGRFIRNVNVQAGEVLKLELPRHQVYSYEFRSQSGTKQGRLMVY